MKTTIRMRIEKGFESFGLLVFNNPWKFSILSLILIISLISQLPKLRMNTSNEGFLHETDPILIRYNDFRKQFGHDELVLVSITAPEIFNRTFLGKLKKLHSEFENSLPYVDDITSLINARYTHGSKDELIVEDLLEHWPENKGDMAVIRARAMSNQTYKNMLLSEDGRVTNIIIRPNAFSSIGREMDVMEGFDDESESIKKPMISPDERPFITEAEKSELVGTVYKISADYFDDNFKIYVAGSPVTMDVLKKAMLANMRRFMLLAIAAIGLILFLVFRRVSGVLLPLFIVIVSLLSTLGIMALTGMPFKMPMTIIPSFLLAVGVGDSVHILAIFYHRLKTETSEKKSQQIYESRNAKAEAIAYSLKHSGLPVFMTSLTTAAGLASFSGAEIAPISDLGIITGIGVLIALAYTLVLIPAVLSFIPLKVQTIQSSGTPWMDRLLSGIAELSTGYSKSVLILSVLIMIFGITGAVQIKFSHKMYEWLPESEPVRQATEFIDKNMKGASLVEIVVDTGRENGLYEPEVMSALNRLGREVENIDNGDLFVGKTLSLSNILKETNQALNGNNPDFYSIPDNRELIAQELLLFENSGSDDMEDFVDSQFRKARFTAKMPWVDAVLYGDFIDDLTRRFKNALGENIDIHVTGMIALLGRAIHATINSLAESYIYAVLVITVMMIVLIGNMRIGLLSMLLNITPIVLTLGVMGWTGIPMDLFTMLIGSIALGLAVDDTIHFMHNFRRYHQDTGDVRQAVKLTLLSTGRAMLITSLVLSSGFFLYMFSTLGNFFNFGLLTGFTIITALMADFFIAPALMVEFHRRRES